MIENEIFSNNMMNPVGGHLLHEAPNAQPGAQSDSQPARIIAVTSGKGGVGKSTVAANLAIALGSFSDQVSLLDADFGLSNIDVLFGMTPQYNIGHVIFGEKEIDEIAITGPNGVRIIPSSSGVQELADMNSSQRRSLIRSLQKYSRDTDWLLIDTAAGISVNVTQLIGMASETIVVTTPEPTAIVDAYAIIKVIAAEKFNAPVSLIVNKAANAKEAEGVANQIRNVTKQFLSRDVEYLGYITRDPMVNKAVMRQEPITLCYPESPASRCFDRIALRLRGDSEPKKASNVLPFWRNVLGINTP